MQLATIGKNLILFKQIASGTIAFATGATAAATTSVAINTPIQPISEYICTIRNNSTQTTINVEVNNVRPMTDVTGVAFLLADASYTTGLAKDTVIEGMFGGNASGVQLLFSLGSAATAAEIISADYQIWEFR